MAQIAVIVVIAVPIILFGYLILYAVYQLGRQRGWGEEPPNGHPRTYDDHKNLSV